MAFTHGKESRTLIDDVSLSAITNSVEFSGEGEVAETTTFTATSDAKTFVRGLNSATVSFAGFYDSAAGDADLAALRTAEASVPLTYGPEGLAVDAPVYLANTKSTTYAISAPVGDVVAFSLDCQTDGPTSRGDSLGDLAARTATANGTSVDGTAATSAGLFAHLHVTAASGTSPTLDVKLQDSADNVSFADIASAAFAQKTAAGSERISTSGTVRRYVRAVFTIGGTTPSFTCQVSFARR